MSAAAAFQLRRVARNRQYLLFTVLLPALFTVFFTKIFGGAGRTAGAVPGLRRRLHGLDDGLRRARRRPRRDDPALVRPGVGLAASAAGHARCRRPTVFAVDVVVGALLTLPSLVVVALVGRFVNGVAAAARTWLALVAVLWAGSVVVRRARAARRAWPWTRRRPAGRSASSASCSPPWAASGCRSRSSPRSMRGAGARDAVVLVRPAGPGRRRGRRRPASRRCWRCRLHRGVRRPGRRRGAAAPAVRGVRMTGATVPGVRPARIRWERCGWALPWLLFLGVPRRRPGRHAAAGAGARGGDGRRWPTFTVAYLIGVQPRCSPAAAAAAWRALVVVAVLGVGARRSGSGTVVGGAADLRVGGRGRQPARALGVARRRWAPPRSAPPSSPRTGCSATCSSCRSCACSPPSRCRARGTCSGQRRARRGARGAGPQRGRARSGCASPATCTTCWATACR